MGKRIFASALTYLLQDPTTCLSPDGAGQGGQAPGADQGEQGNNVNPAANDGAGESRTFSQEDVDRIIADRLKRAEAGFEKKIQSSGFSSIEDLNQAALQIRKAEEERLAQQGQYKELLERTREEKDKTINEYQQRLQAMEAERESMLIDQKLSQAAQGSIAPGQVSALLRSRLRIVDGEPTVHDESGRPMLDGTGNKLTIENFVSQWLNNEGRHFLPAAGGNGAGSTIGNKPGSGAVGYDPSKRHDLDHLQDPKVREDIIRQMKAGKIKM